ncbi:hypothetical protein Tco_0521848 [Tanacetum coccineum]
MFANMKFKWEGQPIPLTPPMLAIAAAGDDADGGDDDANEDNAASNEAAGSAAEAHLVPPSPPVSPVREPTPERQLYHGLLFVHSPIRDPSPDPASPPTPPAPTLIFEEPVVFGPEPRPVGFVDPDVIEPILFGPQPRPHGYVDPDFVKPIILGPQPRPDNYLALEDDLTWMALISYGIYALVMLNLLSFEDWSGTRRGGVSELIFCLSSVAADKGKVSYACFGYNLRAEDLAQEDLPNVSEERAKELDDRHDADDRNRLVDIDDAKLVISCLLEPAITEPPSKRQSVDRVSTQPASVPAATTLPADDPDSAGGGSSNPAGSTTPMTGFDTAGGAFHSAADPSPFLSSIAGGPSPSNVSTDQIPFVVLFASTSGGINEFFLESDEEKQIGANKIKGKSISADGDVLVDKLPDDEIVDPRVKVETISEFASSPPRSRLLESEFDDDMENYIPRFHIGAFKDWEFAAYLMFIVRLSFFLRRRDEIVLSFDDVEDFWRTQNEWIVSRWQLYPKSSVHVLDLTNGKTVYMLWQGIYPFRAATCLKVAKSQEGTAIGKDLLKNPLMCCQRVTNTGMVFIFHLDPVGMKNDSSKEGMGSWVFVLTKVSTSPRVSSYLVKAYQIYLCCCKDWKLLFFDVATSFDYAVHRVHAVSFDAAVLDVAALVSAACIIAAGYIVSAGICDAAGSFVLAVFIYILLLLNPLASRRSI